MKSCDMVIIVPVDGVTGEEAMRVQVWETVAELLRPELGKLYRQFNPSAVFGSTNTHAPLALCSGGRSRRCFGSCSKQEKKRSMKLPPITWRQ